MNAAYLVSKSNLNYKQRNHGTLERINFSMRCSQAVVNVFIMI